MRAVAGVTLALRPPADTDTHASLKQMVTPGITLIAFLNLRSISASRWTVRPSSSPKRPAMAALLPKAAAMTKTPSQIVAMAD